MDNTEKTSYEETVTQEEAPLLNFLNEDVRRLNKLDPEFLVMLNGYLRVLLKDMEAGTDRPFYGGPNVTAWLEALTPEWHDWFARQVQRSRERRQTRADASDDVQNLVRVAGEAGK